MSPRLFLAGSLGFTLLFNVAWSWGTGWLSGIAAGACTLIVPAGLHLWRQVPPGAWYQRAARDVVLAGVCLAALVTSFSHSVAVLTAAGWTDLSAWAVTGGMELIVALSTMAMLAGQAVNTPAGQPADTPEQAKPDTPDRVAPDSPDSPGPAAADNPPDTPDQALSTVASLAADDPIDDLRTWALALGEKPSGAMVRKRYGCGHRRATRLLARLDDDGAGDQADQAGDDEADRAGARNRIGADQAGFVEEGALTS